MTSPVNVLFVCTGNICRSPFCERLVRARARDAGVLAAASAGVRPVRGHPIDAPIAAALRSLGVDPAGHRARAVTAELVVEAHLVLTADSAQRARILDVDPSALRRTFTLREFAHLGAGLPPLAAASGAELTDRVAEVAARRGHADLAEPAALDIGDPFGAPPRLVRIYVDQLIEALGGAMAALGTPLDLHGTRRL